MNEWEDVLDGLEVDECLSLASAALSRAQWLIAIGNSEAK